MTPRSWKWKWKWKHKKRGIPVTKYKSQIILMKKNRLNVEHFHYHITIHYDKSSSACIDLSNVVSKKKEKNLLPNDAPATNWESGKNESRALIFYKKLCKVDPLQFRMMYYSYIYEQKLLQVVSIEKKCNWLHWCLAQTRMQRTFI